MMVNLTSECLDASHDRHRAIIGAKSYGEKAPQASLIGVVPLICRLSAEGFRGQLLAALL
jgi:hypothetical protein